VNQTVKFGKLRASNDGIHFGLNVKRNGLIPRNEGTIIKVTRASFVKSR